MIGVILAAGDGTRLKKSTGQDICKALKLVNGKHLIEFALNNLIALDITEACIVVGKQGDLVKETFGDKYKSINIHYVYQSEQKGLMNAFAVADDILRRGVQSISDLIQLPGIVNLDFEDVKSVMQDAGYAHMGVGAATGKDKAEQAAKEAISSPMLETSIKGAKGILISISVSPDVSLDDVDIASSLIAAEAHPDANVIWGVAFDPELEDEMRITIIATGCGGTGVSSSRVNNPVFDNSAFANPVKQNFMTQSIPAMPAQSVTPAAPAVQQATPRPTSFNVFDFNKIKDDSEVELFTRPVAKPAAQPQPAAETASIPSLTETQVVRNINAAMFNSPEFNAAAPAEEETVAQGSETSEFSAVAEEDRMNGGRGGVEKTMAFAGMDAPAYTRQTMAAEATARTTAPRSDFADSQDFVDLSVPAYLRNRENNMNNF